MAHSLANLENFVMKNFELIISTVLVNLACNWMKFEFLVFLYCYLAENI